MHVQIAHSRHFVTSDTFVFWDHNFGCKFFCGYLFSQQLFLKTVNSNWPVVKKLRQLLNKKAMKKTTVGYVSPLFVKFMLPYCERFLLIVYIY